MLRKTLFDSASEGAAVLAVKKLLGADLSGVLWNARMVAEEALGACFRADVRAKGRRSMNAMVGGAFRQVAIVS